MRWLVTHSITVLRVCLGLVFLISGLLKFAASANPANDLAGDTVNALTLHLVSGHAAVLFAGEVETFIGLTLVTGWALRAGLAVMGVAMIGALSPLVMLTHRLFGAGVSLEAQYVLKDIVLVAAGMVVAAYAHGARLRSEGAAPVTNNVSGMRSMLAQVTQRMSQRSPERSPQRMPQRLPQRLPQGMPQPAGQAVPQQWPQRWPQQRTAAVPQHPAPPRAAPPRSVPHHGVPHHGVPQQRGPQHSVPQHPVPPRGVPPQARPNVSAGQGLPNGAPAAVTAGQRGPFVPASAYTYGRQVPVKQPQRRSA